MQGGGFLIFLVALFAIMYFLLIRPQRAKQKAAQELLNRVAPGDEVVTIGGIYGDVVEVQDDKVVLEIAEDVHIEVARKAIAQIVPEDTGYTEPDAFGRSDDRTAGELEEPADVGERHPVQGDKRFGGVFGRRTG